MTSVGDIVAAPGLVEQPTEALEDLGVQQVDPFAGQVELDVQHALVERTGAKITPEAAVFVAGVDGPQLVYCGRIDDRYVEFGVERPAPTRNDLEEVIRRLIAGQRVELRRTQAVGCTIAELPNNERQTPIG